MHTRLEIGTNWLLAPTSNGRSSLVRPIPLLTLWISEGLTQACYF